MTDELQINSTRQFVIASALCALFGVMIGVGFYITFLPYHLKIDAAVAVMVILFCAGGVFACSIKVINLWMASGKTMRVFFNEDIVPFIELYKDDDEDD